MVDVLISSIGVVLGLAFVLILVGVMAYLAVNVLAGIAFGLLYGYIVLDENNWFLRPGKEKASVRRHRRRQEETTLANVNARQEWVDSIVRRARSFPGGQAEILQIGSPQSRIYLKVTDPGGCVAGYEVWTFSDGWRVYLLGEIQQFGVEAEVDETIEECRLSAREAPWVVSLSGVFVHQVLLEVIEYQLEYPEGL